MIDIDISSSSIRDELNHFIIEVFSNLNNLCIYGFFDSFLVETWSDAVMLVSTDKSRDLEYFVISADCKLSNIDLQTIIKEKLDCKNTRSDNKFLSVMVYLHSFGSSDKTNPYFLVLIHPRILKLESERRSLELIIENLASMWFWRASYLYEKRMKLCENLGLCEIKKTDTVKVEEERKKLLESVIWPIPFWDYVNLINLGWFKLSYSDDFDEKKMSTCRNWSFLIRKHLCISNQKKCAECKGRQDEKANKEKELLNKIIPLILYADSEHAEDKEYYIGQDFGKSFDILVSFRKELFDKIDFQRLSEEGLTCFFAFKLWDEFLMDPVNRLKWENEVFSVNEKVRLLSSCTNILFHILKRKANDSGYINSIRWAISAYGNEILSVEPRFDISAHLQFAARGEPALHSLKPYYRDHFFHAIEVCFLGHLLLDCKISGLKGYLWQSVAKYAKLKTKAEVLRYWYVTSLFHDIGYAIEIFNSTRRVFDFFSHSSKISNFIKNLDKAVSELSKDFKDFFGFIPEDGPEKDHGVIAAEHMSALRDTIDKDAGKLKQYDCAFRAIAFHNHRKVKVSFKNDPFAFLLILCDTLQEWNRPHLNFSNAPDIMLAKLLPGSDLNSGFSYTGPLDTVNVSIDKGQEESFCFRYPDKLIFQLHYTDEINVNSGVFNLWLDSTCNLQRLVSDGLPFDIELQYITPLFNVSGKFESQMHRLREAAAETHMNMLHEWFPVNAEKGVSTNGAITHYTDVSILDKDCRSPENHEALVINLKKLGNKVHITEDISVFRSKLQKWKRFNEDRDFKGDYVNDIPG